MSDILVKVVDRTDNVRVYNCAVSVHEGIVTMEFESLSEATFLLKDFKEAVNLDCKQLSSDLNTPID